MLFLLIGVVGIVLKYLEIGPFATLSWWIVLIPFALAVLWWAWADASGYTKRKEMDALSARTTKRINKQREKMGLPPQGRSKK